MEEEKVGEADAAVEANEQAADKEEEAVRTDMGEGQEGQGEQQQTETQEIIPK